MGWEDEDGGLKTEGGGERNVAGGKAEGRLRPEVGEGEGVEVVGKGDDFGAGVH
jgi:hypothetical protein